MADGQDSVPVENLAARKPPSLAILPISIARSSLFSIAPRGPMSQYRVIETAKKGVNATITYTGPHLSMEHFRLWQALLYIADQRGQLGGEEFQVSVSEVLQHMGKGYTGVRLNKKISLTLTDLMAAVVTVISDRVYYKNEKLIDVGDMDLQTRTLTVKFGERIATNLLDREILKNNIERSRELKRHHLAIWLHGFISSQASRPDKKNTRHTFLVDELQRLCGSQAKERRHFCEDLGRALNRLKTEDEGGLPLVADWRWDDKRTKNKVIVEKAHTLVKLLNETAETAKSKRGETAAQAARSRKAKVAL